MVVINKIINNLVNLKFISQCKYLHSINSIKKKCFSTTVSHNLTGPTGPNGPTGPTGPTILVIMIGSLFVGMYYGKHCNVPSSNKIIKL